MFLVLALDEPQVCAVRLWEMRQPLNTPACPTADERIALEKAHWAKFYQEKPEFASIHYVRADGPGECISALDYDLLNGAQFLRGVPQEYNEWYLGLDTECAQR